MQALASLAWQSNSLSGGNGWGKQPCASCVCRPSFTRQCLGIMGASWKLIWCFKAGMKLSIRSVQGLRLKEATWALSSCEWAVCDFGRGMRTQTQKANQASREMFGSVSTCTFDTCGRCS